MIDEAYAIAARLERSIDQANAYATELTDEDMHRYALEVVALLTREHGKLIEMLRRDDPNAIRWALRSVSDAQKGLIDVGSDWRERCPEEWHYLMHTTSTAHQLEIINRVAT